MLNETEKLRAIYRLLFDLATGKRPVVIDKPAITDAYDDIHITLYALGARLRDLVLASSMVPPYTAYAHVSSYVFVLDAGHRLVDFNTKVTERLGYAPGTIRYRLFEDLLTSDSALDWHRHMTAESETARFFVVVDLVFLAENGTHLPLYCTVSNAFFQDWVFVLSVEVHLAAVPTETELPDTVKKEAVVIEQLHTYILEHLDEALPSVRALALRLGSEEHKLRQGFKAYYHTSIYQFYQEERLKKGYQLIVHTRLQLKEIAYQCGFSSYINFYKAFKKRYGMAPSALLRPK